MNAEPDHSAPAPRPFFQVALNLPHAGRVARRIVQQLPAGRSATSTDGAAALRLATELVELLDPCLDADENPPAAEASKLRDRAAKLGRTLVDHVECGGIGHDRLGQCVRNLFECLELGLEGAEISLRAGEDPKSMQRPF